MSSFGVIWIYHIIIHNPQKVSTSYSFFFPQRINKNYQVYPLVVEHGQAATSGWCADSKRGRYRLFTRIVDVGMGQKGGELASNGGNIITPKCNFERNNMWSTHGQTSNLRVLYVFVFRRRHLYHHLGVCNFGNIGGAYFLLRHLLHLVCFALLFGWHPHFVLDSAGGLPPSKTIACRWYKPAGTPHQKRCEVQVGRLRKLNISSLQFGFQGFRTHDCIFVASTKTNSGILVIFDLHSVFWDAEKLEVPF